MFALIMTVFCVLSFYIWYQRKALVWSKQKIPMSHYRFFETLKIPFFQMDSDLVAQYGKVVGFMTFCRPSLLIADLEVTKAILNDLEHFPNRFKFGAERNKTGENMLFSRDSKWRKLRQIVTPAFSPNKVRRMIPLIENSVRDLIEALETSGSVVDVKPYFSGFTLDAIASCAFGIKLNSAKDPNNEFVKNGQKFFGSISLNTILVLIFPTFATEVLNLHGFNNEAANFFYNLTLQIIQTRRETKIDKEYNDFIDLLMKAEYEGQLLTDKQISDQGIAFFLAGFDTSSVTLTTIAYLLAKHQHIQNRLSAEINKFFAETSNVSYESINSLNYLDAVVNETLRHFPTVPRMMKEAAKNCLINFDGRDVFVPKGTFINMSIHCIHRDELNFQDANQFQPERFLKDSELRHNSQAFIPFGTGPRNCVGSRFAMLEIKLCIINLIRKFQLDIASETEPLKFMGGPGQPVSSTKTMYLKLTNR